MALRKIFSLGSLGSLSRISPLSPFSPIRFQSLRFVGNQVKVILKQDVKDFGKKGDVLSVKRGTARLQMIPFDLAWYATPHNIKKHSRFGREIPTETMMILNRHRKAVNAISNTTFRFLRYLKPEETNPEATDMTFQSEEKRKKDKKKKKEPQDPECEAITSEVVMNFLREKLRLVISEEDITLPQPITEFGDHIIPIRINHVLVSGVEERYMDPDLLQNTDYQLKITLDLGYRAKPEKGDKEDASKAAAAAETKAADPEPNLENPSSIPPPPPSNQNEPPKSKKEVKKEKETKEGKEAKEQQKGEKSKDQKSPKDRKDAKEKKGKK